MDTIAIVKWVFLSIGLACLGGATQADHGGAWVLVILGLAFAGVGGGLIGYGWWSARRATELREHGRLIEADFQQVELNTSLEVNGSNPFRIVAQ
ncbi:MAG: hypothetical protein RI907_3137, partial [Pseudomonadota bacterium]